MKKLLGTVLALALVASVSQANAELLKNFKFGGSVEVDAVSARNAVNFTKNPTNAGVSTDRVGTAQTRIMLNMDWDLLDDVHAKMTLSKNNRVYGATADGHNGSENMNTVQTNVYIDQGYFKIDKLFGFADSSFGRMFYGEPGDLIFYAGPKYDEYGMNITAIDGARFDWNGEKVYASALMFEPSSNGAALGVATLGAQTDVRGFVVGNKGDEHIDAKVYLWNMEQHGVLANVERKNTNLYIPGFKVKAKFGGLYGSLEAAFNHGEDRQNSGGFSGKAFLADVGMKADVEQIGTFNPWAQWAYGSGNGTAAGVNQQHNMDFQALLTDYKPGAIYGRFNANEPNGATKFDGGAPAAGNGLQNRIIWGLGVKATPSALNKLTAGVGYYDFNFQNLGAGSGINAGNRHIGSEVDVTAEWKHSENVSIKGTIGDFQPGGYIRNMKDHANYNAVTGAPGAATLTHTSAALLTALDVTVKF